MGNLKKTFTMFPIGHVNASEDAFSLQIYEDYRNALKKTDQFSHILVFWWVTKQDNEKSRAILETPLPYADNMNAGVFACRSEYRPNPIAVTVCAILDMDWEKGVINVPYMDAFDKTPIVDIKPYIPVSDRVREAAAAPWMETWPQWYEDAYKLQEIFEQLA
ncbi:MAG: SAM-dependent methyltransferase [Desulfobacteraceae bacterium]|nr:SAM-dependent methyltransferase [Desulfobacteraceae bacterium]